MKKLYRCRWDKKFAGVLGGIGQRINVDPNLLRPAYIFFTLATGIMLGLALYLIAAVLLPEGPRHMIEPRYKKFCRSRKNRLLAGVCGGLAEYFNINVSLIRIIFIILPFITLILPPILFYLSAIVLVPEKGR